MEQREMYAEMNLLLSVIARELGITAKEAVDGIEAGTITVATGEGDNGERYLALDYQGKTARVYQSALGAGGSSCDCGEAGCGDDDYEEISSGCCGNHH